MQRNYSSLLKQLQQLGAEHPGELPSIDRWMQFLDQATHSTIGMATEHAGVERNKDYLASENQDLSSRIEETQRIAGLGDWSFDRRLGLGKWSRECYRIFGLSPSAPMPTYKELSRQIHRDDRLYVKDRVEAALHDNRKFEIEFRYRLPDGEIRWVRAIGQPVKNARGQVCRMFGTVMDVNSRKLIEVRQSMEHTVARLLAECDSPVEVIPEIIETICATFGWSCGALWMPDKKAAVLRRIAAWTLPRPDVENFFHNTPDQIPLPASGALSSRTLRVARADWFPDASRGEHFERATQAASSNLHGCLAFPLQAAGEILGIMEFFGPQAQEADRETLQSAHFIGRHIGQFFQRKQVEQALRESEAHFRALVEQASDSFYVHDMEGKFIDVNQQGCEGLGYTRAELLSMSAQDVDLDLTSRELKKLTARIGTGAPIARESRYRRKDGSTFPVEIRMGPIDINGRQHLLSLVRDVTERKDLQDHIQHLAYHDSLTNLPNRAMFNRHLSHAIDQAGRHGSSLAVLFIDLDRFKYVNDSLGHPVGDALLRIVAERFATALREEDTLSRIGGDEFVVILEELGGADDAARVARKLLDALETPSRVDGHDLFIGASIGISLFPTDGDSIDTLVRCADSAMYRAKEVGRNTFQFFTPEQASQSRERFELERDLRQAVERGELRLVYQPQADCATGRIVGVEALVRWQHPTRGLVPPDRFIPLAEEIGLISKIGAWVLNAACAQAYQWEKQGRSLRIAVNLSGQQISRDGLVELVREVLGTTGLSPTQLELEITEGHLLQRVEQCIATLRDLKSLGVTLAIDDFGTGYSSLSYLKKLPVDRLKIDRSFVEGIPDDRDDVAIVATILSMARNLGLDVIAEGVENETQLAHLRDARCAEYQGYLLSRPVSPAELEALLDATT